MNNKAMVESQYPDDTDPEVAKVKKLASRSARLEGRLRGVAPDKRKTMESQYAKSLTALKVFMSTLKWSRLFYWRDVLLIDPRWCGATGTGAYIAVASRLVNETATEILKDNPAPLFWIED